ncbi:MAG: FKBP-type peptidyl-prolyl cis-trans isomerase [Bacteroidota bacterium]
MRFQLFILALFLGAFTACQPTDKAPQEPTEENADEAAQRPTVEAPEAATPNLAEDELLMKLSALLIAEPQTLADSNRNEIVNYAIDQQLNLDHSDSGLFYQILDPGEGDPLQWGDRVVVHYRGYFLDGKEFDSSYKRNRPIKFYIGNMIDAWNEGMQLLRPKGRALFITPSNLGYGEVGIKISEEEYMVPPNAILAFEVAVMEKVE